MEKKAASGSNLVGGKTSGALLVDSELLEGAATLIQEAGYPIGVQTLAQRLVEDMVGGGSVPAPPAARVKRYDHRCNYEEGERVFLDNRYGRSFATITKIIRQPENAFCDKAFMEFDDPEYTARWQEERSTPYFAINSGRTNAEPVYVDAEPRRTARSRAHRMNATAVAKLAKLLERALKEDSRFGSTPEGWLPASLVPAGDPSEDMALGDTPARPHISAERGGTATGALPQGSYKAPLLEVLDKMGEATIDEIKRNVQSSLKLGPADWETDPTGKIVWIHRLHAAIKHLKRVGAIDSPRREVYRRISNLRRESA